jgi:hypothetical protein
VKPGNTRKAEEVVSANYTNSRENGERSSRQGREGRKGGPRGAWDAEVCLDLQGKDGVVLHAKAETLKAEKLKSAGEAELGRDIAESNGKLISVMAVHLIPSSYR